MAQSHNNQKSGDLSPARQLDLLINGFRVTPLLYVVAKLGIADLLHQRPQTSVELAARCGVNAPALYRVLRTLSSLGIFCENADGQFAMTELAQPLRTDVDNSVHATAMMWGHPQSWSSYGNLIYSVETGQPAFEHIFGMGSFDYYGQNPEAGRIFNNYMTERTARDIQAIVRACDLSRVRVVVDVGGGQGALLAAVLRAQPHVRGVLFEQAAVLPKARQLLEAEGLLERCDMVPGDFFADAVPSYGDVYMLKWIIHDWDDERSLAILRNCRRNMPAHARLLLIEQVIRPENPESYRTDIAMLLFTGGRERAEAEYHDLLAAAGFHLTRVLPTSSSFDIVEAVPV